MRQFKILGVAMATALLVAACGGGGGDGDQAPAIKFTSLVSFGDSLSDIGTYKIPAIAALGGGTYSINGIAGAIGSNPTPSKNWIELVAAQAGVPAPCPAQTGLDGDANQNLSVPVVNHPGCYAYAQGGSRVTDPIGAHHKATGDALGQLTVPVKTQILNHLAATGGKFSGGELVTVLAGGNDIFRLLDDLKAAATAAGTSAFGNTLVGGLVALVPNPADQPAAALAIGTALQTAAAAPSATTTSIVTAAVTAASGQPGVSLPINPTPIVTAATTAANTAGANYAATNGPLAVAAMAQAGGELAAYVKNLIVANGATHVAVVNLPDVSLTPSSKEQSVETQALIGNMVIYFNNQLQTGVAGLPGVIVVDAYADNRNQIANPASYALTNVQKPACGANALEASSLVCNANNVIAGDVSRYLFADSVHPTPYGYKLLAQLTTKSMVLAGWL